MSFPQITPARPVPGAFLNTPALASRYASGPDPTRRTLFQTSNNNSASGPSNQSGGSLTAANDGSTARGLQPVSAVPPPKSASVPPVVKAAAAINSFLRSDENYPGLDSYFQRECFSSYSSPATYTNNWLQRAFPPTTICRRLIPLLLPSIRHRCTRFPTRYSITTMLGSSRP